MLSLLETAARIEIIVLEESSSAEPVHIPVSRKMKARLDHIRKAICYVLWLKFMLTTTYDT
ncbi:hypothetical protein N7467_004468 [Penicillium canescens]|nr:hypothetical protein N7467_004468 [Penicillium canescens]